MQEVTGSSPVPSTKTKPEAAGPGFLFCAGIAEAHPVRVLYCCASEALPAAEAAELEQGQRSEYSSALHACRKFRAPQPDPPNKAYPNPVLYEEGFGYVFLYQKLFAGRIEETEGFLSPEPANPRPGEWMKHSSERGFFAWISVRDGRAFLSTATGSQRAPEGRFRHRRFHR